MDFTIMFVLGIICAYLVISFWDRRDRTNFRMTESMRLRRVEKKLDLILEDANIDFANVEADIMLTQEERDLADTMKISAIKLYKERTGANLEDAKWVIDNYLREKRKM